MPNGNKVRAIMKEKNMTQADLSRATGIEDSNISLILNKKRNIRETTLYKLCKGLGCKPEEIMLEVEE